MLSSLKVGKVRLGFEFISIIIERSFCMNWNTFTDVCKDVVRFFDRVMGWVAYVVGAEDDPYGYTKFYDTIWGDKEEDKA